MSEQSGGPGWWQASDGKWYPPEQAPTAAQPGVEPTAVQPGVEPTAAQPGVGPTAPPPAYAPPAAGAAAAGGGAAGKVIAIVVVLALLAGGGAYLLTKGGGSSGSVASFCNTVKSLNNDTSLNNAFSDPGTVDKIVVAFGKLTSAAPSEIKADMNLLNDDLKKAAAAVKAGKSPDSALSGAEQTKFTDAAGRVDAFSLQKCGVDLNGSSSSSSVFTSSPSFDSSTFDSSTFDSSSFDSSSFDSSLSSQASSLCEQFGTEFGSDFCSSS